MNTFRCRKLSFDEDEKEIQSQTKPKKKNEYNSKNTKLAKIKSTS